MSYNGIGLSTPRGTGTNGYIQKNYSRQVESNYAKRQKIKQAERKQSRVSLAVDKSLIEHGNKRNLEVKVSEYRDTLEDEGLEEDEIEKKCNEYREKLVAEQSERQEEGRRMREHRKIRMDTYKGAAYKEVSEVAEEAEGAEMNY